MMATNLRREWVKRWLQKCRSFAPGQKLVRAATIGHATLAEELKP